MSNGITQLFSDRPNEMRTIRDVYVNEELNGYEIPYVIYLPVNYDETKSYPVILYLHGAGERGRDNEAQVATNIIDQLYQTRFQLMNEVIFLAPQCPDNEQWVNWPWVNGNYVLDEIPESRALSTVKKLLDKILSSYAADENRVYILGVSMGGFGTWDMLARHSSTFAAGIPLCGGGSPSSAGVLKDIPIWCVHGTADPGVPYEGTEEMYYSILSVGGDHIIFDSMEGYGHNVWDYASTSGERIDWLFAQTLAMREEQKSNL